MKHPIPTKNATLLLTAVLILLFALFVIAYAKHLKSAEQNRLNSHAQVISPAVWSYLKDPSKSFLALAAEANGYHEVRVLEENGDTFLEIQGKEPSRLEKFLSSVDLIKVETLQTPIFYEGRDIGILLVKWPNRAVYVCFYVFILLALILSAIGLYLKLLDAKVFLERRVKQRTTELEKEIQERKRAEDELKYQTQKLAMHVQQTPLGVVEWSPGFKIVEWNKAAEEIFEFSRAEIIGKRPLGLIIQDQDVELMESIWEKLLRQSGGTRSTNRNITKSGKVKTCTWYNTPLINPTGEIVGVGSLVLDITDQLAAETQNKMLQEQLLQAQKMEAVGNLAGGVAHDFNNILQSISGYTQLLLLECTKNGADCSKLQGIEKASSRASELIRQMLTFSRKIRSNLKPLNLNIELQQVRAMLDRSIPKMVAIDMRLEPELWPVKADPVQIEQIVLNLAINAQHAMADGGTFGIRTTNVQLDAEFCSTHVGTRLGQNVLLEISDTGSGMDQETLSRIFEPFFTTKATNKGTGLGLASVYGIVQAHQAYIECESTIGTGTKFRIYFPAATEQPEPASAATDGMDLAGGKETILLVDDEPTIRDIGREMLETQGYCVLAAENGERAIEIYRKLGNTIDLTIMDLNMPGMGGLKCMQALHEMDPSSLIVVASGYTPSEFRQKAIDCGARGFVSKPFQMADFLRKIRQILDNCR